MALTVKNLKRMGRARQIEKEEDHDNQEHLAAAPRPDPVLCIVCGGAGEESPMRENTCYDCHRNDGAPADWGADLGQHTIISGGEVLELNPNRPLDDEFSSWDEDPGYF